MSYLSNLTLALSVFSDKDITAISVSKSDPEYYQVFYRLDGANRAMLVPRKAVDSVQLQMEVATLLSRTASDQQRLGHLDATPNKKAA